MFLDGKRVKITEDSTQAHVNRHSKHYKLTAKVQRSSSLSYRDIRKAGVQLVTLTRNSNNATMAKRLLRIKISARHVQGHLT